MEIINQKHKTSYTARSLVVLLISLPVSLSFSWTQCGVRDCAFHHQVEIKAAFPRQAYPTGRCSRNFSPLILFLEPDSNTNDGALDSVKQDLPTSATNESIEESKPYPLEVPSAALLGSSILLAIVGTGSIFELIGPNAPPLGAAPTAALAVVGVPLSLFLFYAAILKAQAETEEDDKKFGRD